MRMASFGFTNERMAISLGISKKTLVKHYAEEIEKGKSEVEYKVGNSIVEKALGNSSQAVPAAKFFLSSKCGWKEAVINENKNEHTIAAGEILNQFVEVMDGLAASKSASSRKTTRVAKGVKA